MIAQEAIKAIEDGVCRFCTIDEHCDDCEFQMAMDALERQIPMKPFKLSPLSEEYYCPYCDNVHYDKKIGGKISVLCQVNLGDRYCTCCGQALDWSEVNDE